jgi:hypothetical protein
MPDHSSRWEAWLDHGSLHVAGSATRFPDDFSTASLAREPDDPSMPEVLIYRVVFHRDKEPFCGPDLIGPVHYVEHVVPANTRRIRIIAAEGVFDVPLADRPPDRAVYR